MSPSNPLTLDGLFIVGEVLTFLVSFISSASSCLSHLRGTDSVGRGKSSIYKDIDGEALPDFSPSQRRWRWVWNFAHGTCAISGAGIAMLRACMFVDDYEQLYVPGWTSVGIWLSILFHSGMLALEPHVRTRYIVARNCIVCALCASILTLLDMYRTHDLTNSIDLRDQLTVGELVILFSIVLLGLSLPRRPDLFVDTKMVDRESACSLISRWTFSWPGFLLGLTTRRGGVAIGDLPVLGFENRAKYLLEKFVDARHGIARRLSHRAPLWGILLLANAKHVALQTALTTIINFFMFTPHFALFRLLQLLESDTTNPSDRTNLWFWVLAFGCLTSLSSFLENWVHWINQNKVSIRLQEQLVIAMYGQLIGDTTTLPDSHDGVANMDGDDLTTAQNVANLIAVDAHRIAKCAAIVPRAFTVPLRLAIACLILKRLLGLESFVAVVATVCLVAPLKFWCFHRYTDTGNELMSRRDRRIAVVNEALLGVRQIKMSATEELWEARIDNLRSDELRAQRKAFTLAAAGVSVQLLGSLLLSASAIAVHVYFHGALQPSIAFTALAIMGSVDAVLFSLPEMLVEVLDAAVSLRRIDRFFQQRNGEAAQYPWSETISFENVTARWKKTDGAEAESTGKTFALRNISLTIPSRGLTAIVGPTGSGKSLMLAAILGECDIVRGVVKSPKAESQFSRQDLLDAEGGWILHGAMAYVSQQPWIEPTTVRENILFGLPLDGPRYRQVLFACALLPDLAILKDGDLTQVGDSGINLSGGQRWRVSLARALYSRAGTLVLDDIFSAIDVHTSAHVYAHALTGSLAVGRTRVLVTHNLDLCRPDYIVQLSQGEIQFAGTAGQLQKPKDTDDLLPSACVSLNEDRPHGTPRTADPEHESSTQAEPPSPSVAHQEIQTLDTIIEGEGRQYGSIQTERVRRYFAKCGRWPFILLVICFYLAYSGLLLGRGWWMKIWSAQSAEVTAKAEQYHQYQLHAFAQHVIGSLQIDRGTQMFIGIYVMMSALAWIAGSVRAYLLLVASLRASRVMFQSLLTTVLRAPLGWLDTTPVGRLMNRFTSDFDMLDAYLGFDLSEFLASIMDCAMVLIPSTIASPALALVAFALLGLCILYTRWYLTMAREMKRLESVARSPIYDQLGSSLKGLWTIRAFGRTQDYVDRMQDAVDRHARAAWQLWLLSRWLGFRMNLIGSVFCTATAGTVVLQGGTGAAFAGFALTFSVQLTHSMTRAILAYACFELDMNGAERIFEYTDVETEDFQGRDPPAAWPTKGCIEVVDLALRYAPHLPPVISDLNLRIESHQRVAVVGRTGAGKSSLALSLFRLLEAEKGQILVDGIDIAKAKLHHLRSRLAMIPQDPVLFSGTVRSNLDPFGDRTDGELLYALEQVHWSGLTLAEYEDGHVDKTQTTTIDCSALDEPVMELGSNFSQGQRQLLCLARAVASRPKVLIMDEATSAVDKLTDRLIQTSLRSSFENISTLLVIAHRLSTIADFDRILVLEAGRMVEFGHPKELLKITGGVFRSMIDESPDSESIRARIAEI